jgi:hypothetical protein
MRTFTVTDAPIAEIADRLRENRDRSALDWAHDFSRPQDRDALIEFVRNMVDQEGAIRRYHEGEAMKGALVSVLNEVGAANPRDLDGASVTITLSDFVATATLNLPQTKFEPVVIDPDEIFEEAS